MCRIEVKGPAHFSFYYFSLLSITVGGFSHEKNISSIFQCKRNNQKSSRDDRMRSHQRNYIQMTI